jgi:hypothetical protein
MSEGQRGLNENFQSLVSPGEVSRKALFVVFDLSVLPVSILPLQPPQNGEAFYANDCMQATKPILQKILKAWLPPNRFLIWGTSCRR